MAISYIEIPDASGMVSTVAVETSGDDPSSISNTSNNNATSVEASQDALNANMSSDGASLLAETIEFLSRTCSAGG